MEDVIVIGAGPAGCAAAKRCAENDLNTLLLEKAELPRDKVCSGMIMGPVAQTLLKQEYGEIPKRVLAHPAGFKGYQFHVPGSGSARLDNDTPLTWRRDLDHWLCRQTEQAGVKLWSEARAMAVRPDGWGYMVLVGQKGDQRLPVTTRYLIAADGGNSMVRKFLYPNLDVKFASVFQECLRLELDLEPEYNHWFYPPELFPGIFTTHYKDGTTVIDYAAGIEQVKTVRQWGRDYLAAHHGLDPDAASVWEGACMEPLLLGELFSGAFIPANGNALLTGDAAGLLLPVSGEGIGTALQSGLAAADAVIAAAKSGEEAYRGYLERIEGMVEAFGEIALEFRKVRDGFKAGDGALADLLAAAYRATLRPH